MDFWKKYLLGKTLPSKLFVGTLCFFESFLFPFPPDPWVVSALLDKISDAWKIAFLCTFCSVLGGIVGYGLGYYCFHLWGSYMLTFYGWTDKFTHLCQQFQVWGIVLILIKGLTPLPYKLVAITCGIMKMNIIDFLWASMISRGVRFYGLAGVMVYGGSKFHQWVRRFLPILTILFLGISLLGICSVRFF